MISNRWLVEQRKSDWYSTNSVPILTQRFSATASSQTGVNSFQDTRLYTYFELYQRALKAYEARQLERYLIDMEDYD